jgi:uncharacterized protein
MAYLHGKFVWFEHVSNDNQGAGRFYDQLFGWSSEGFPMGDGQTYYMVKNAGAGVGGYRTAPAGVPNHWLSYLSVADVDKTAKAAEAAGAKVLMPPADFPPVGRGAALADPTGAAFSIWKSNEGDAPDHDPARIGDWYWNELSTPDEKKALAFYEKIFGYAHDTMDMGPQGTYYILKKDDKPRGGLMKSPMPNMPAGWLPYVLVANCDASLARAKQLGAKECMGATDIPNVGRFAIVNDPTGAMIAFMNKA